MKTLTPKAVLHQRFGNKACYKVEEIKESAPNECPGLAMPQKGPPLFRCVLELPELTVTSETFRRKKDAEQSAAEIAINKLGIDLVSDNPTEGDASEALTGRLRYVFSNEFLSSLHPLSGHIKAALRRDGNQSGVLPASVIAACDAKSKNLCKLINSSAESNPLLSVSLVVRAAAKLSELVVPPEQQLTIRKCSLCPLELAGETGKGSTESESVKVGAIYIPSSQNDIIRPVTLHVSPDRYYLDVIAQELGEKDASRILLSRTVGKASSEIRFHFAAPQFSMPDLSSDLLKENGVHAEGSLNVRASYLSGQHIYGDAIMASIGYTWRSEDLFHEDLTLQSYNRMILSKTPSGIYKLSRDAVLVAELPLVFTTKANWRGSFPKEILCSFCSQHRLSEPSFSTIPITSKSSSELSRSNKKLKITEAVNQELAPTVAIEHETAGDGEEKLMPSERSFRCQVKLSSKYHNSAVECSPKEIYKKQTESSHKVSLKVLSWLNAYFKDVDISAENLKDSANTLDIKFDPKFFYEVFQLYLYMNRPQQNNKATRDKLVDSQSIDMMSNPLSSELRFLKIEGSDDGVSPTHGSMLCISYSAKLVSVGEQMKELVESKDEFEFEVGTGAVIPQLEAVLSQMSVGQSAFFTMDLPQKELILAAAAGDASRILSLLSSEACYLDYHITLLSVTAPPEERMEQALFSPPLSKQRVEYAVQQIRKSCATTLVDYGCGSGSLLDSLLDYPTSLQKIVGIDLSQKSLARAAKILHAKLSADSDICVKSAILYYGSITESDSRLCGFDIGTCLEVIEHMEEEEASMFGDIALGYFRPKILIVSTPNYEYNVILQRSTQPGQEEDPDDKSQVESCRFRNHDHKFEWTREQFERWASELAKKHLYSVDFSGVGGSVGVEPGFASQIAVFKSEPRVDDDGVSRTECSAPRCSVIWQWNGMQVHESFKQTL